MNLKTCSRCKLSKNIDNFYIQIKTKDGHTSWCKDCCRENARERAKLDHNKKAKLESSRKWRENNLQRSRDLNNFWASKNKKALKDRSLRNTYGISLEEYNLLLVKQDNKCAICYRHQNEFKKSLAVDHDHNNGKIRGLLCDNCNRGLGFFKDSASLTLSATEYLNKEISIL